jgi:hypothetical protein
VHDSMKAIMSMSTDSKTRHRTDSRSALSRIPGDGMCICDSSPSPTTDIDRMRFCRQDWPPIQPPFNPRTFLSASGPRRGTPADAMVGGMTVPTIESLDIKLIRIFSGPVSCRPFDKLMSLLPGSQNPLLLHSAVRERPCTPNYKQRGFQAAQ